MCSDGSESECGIVDSGVPQGSVVYSLLFMININDLEGLKSHVKFFTRHTSLFPIVRNPNTTADDLNQHLNVINQWEFQWKMSFNPDPNKQAVQLIFYRKGKKKEHPKIYFSGIVVTQEYKHKHLCLHLDSKLSFASQWKIKITRRGIGIINTPYLPVSTLD